MADTGKMSEALGLGAVPKPVRGVLLGAPGSGKGTQAARLSKRLGVPAISTGEMLREAVTAGSDLGRRVEKILISGALVDDQAMRKAAQWLWFEAGIAAELSGAAAIAAIQTGKIEVPEGASVAAVICGAGSDGVF